MSFIRTHYYNKLKGLNLHIFSVKKDKNFEKLHKIVTKYCIKLLQVISFTNSSASFALQLNSLAISLNVRVTLWMNMRNMPHTV